MISRLILYFKTLRGLELLLMLGSPILGVLFAKQASGIDRDFVYNMIVFLIATYCLGGHIYAFNSWAGLKADIIDKSKKDFPHVAGSIGKDELLYLSLILLAVSVIGYVYLSITLVVLALLDALLWVLYCHPQLLFKSKPVVGSVIHLITGTINFLLGYLLVSQFDLKGVLIGLYFAIIFTGGHLNHELRDYEADKENGYNTNAIFWGKKPVFITSVLLFTFSNLYLLLLVYLKMLDIYSILPAFIFYPLYLYFAYTAFKEGLSFSSMDRFRTEYRVLYALFGIYLLIYLLIPYIKRI
jgi:lycopene elongase/hydratase (dihydrobisanhydrobacterioruberin-forming)